MSEAVALKEALLFWVSQSKSVFRQRETDTRAHRLSRRRLRFQSLDTRNRFLLSDRGICAFGFNVIACLYSCTLFICEDLFLTSEPVEKTFSFASGDVF